MIDKTHSGGKEKSIQQSASATRKHRAKCHLASSEHSNKKKRQQMDGDVDERQIIAWCRLDEKHGVRGGAMRRTGETCGGL